MQSETFIFDGIKGLQSLRGLTLPARRLAFPIKSCFSVDFSSVGLVTPRSRLHELQLIKAIPEKNRFMNAGNYIDQVPGGAIIVVDNGGRLDCTSWGNILTTKALQKQIAGSVIHGSARDITDIRKMDYPLFANNIYMVSGKNRARVKAVQCAIDIHGVTVCPGDWVFGDDNGVLVIPEEQLEEVIRRAENVETTERQIINTINAGTPLNVARQQLGYDVPWENKV